MEAVTVADSGLNAPRRSVISSTAPAEVTAATIDTASPPRPLWLLPGSCRMLSGSTARGAGHTANVVTMAGRKDARPAANSAAPRCPRAHSNVCTLSIL